MNNQVVGGLHGYNSSRRVSANKVVASKVSSAKCASDVSAPKKLTSDKIKTRRENWGVLKSSEITFDGQFDSFSRGNLMKTCTLETAGKDITKTLGDDIPKGIIKTIEFEDIVSTDVENASKAVKENEFLVLDIASAVGKEIDTARALSAEESVAVENKSATKTSMFSEMLKDPNFKIIKQNELAVAFYDKFPVNPGHALVITKRVIPDYWAATTEEKAAVWQLVREVKEHIDHSLFPKPHGYDLKTNELKPKTFDKNSEFSFTKRNLFHISSVTN